MGQRKILFKQAKHWEGHSHSCLKALHATLTAKARRAELRSHTAKAAWCQNGITIHIYCLCPWEAEPWAGQCGAALRSLSQEDQEGANPPWLMSPGTPPSPAAGSTPRKPLSTPFCGPVLCWDPEDWPRGLRSQCTASGATLVVSKPPNCTGATAQPSSGRLVQYKRGYSGH